MLHRPDSSRKRVVMILAIIAGLALPALAAQADGIFINATEVSGTSLSDRVLRNVESVRFDSEGNVHIVAPGYNIQITGRDDEAPRDADAFELITGQRYLLVLSNPSRGGVPYAVEVFVNGRSVAQYGHNRGNAAMDITGYMALGDNEVRVVATRVAGAQAEPDAQLRVMIGPGEMEGRRASLQSVAAGLAVNGGDTDATKESSVSFEIETIDDED